MERAACNIVDPLLCELYKIADDISDLNTVLNLINAGLGNIQ